MTERDRRFIEETFPVRKDRLLCEAMADMLSTLRFMSKKSDISKKWSS